jgi:cell division septum initiation protein DivIVA
MRGYDAQEVDQFLELAAERLEELVKENLALKGRVEGLEVRVRDREGREKAVQEALVTAQALREDIKEQAGREAELIRREAEAAAQTVRDGVDRLLEERRGDLRRLARSRSRFLKTFRVLLEREMDMLEAEESNPPPLELDRDALEEVGEEALDEVRDDALEIGEVHPMDAFPWDDPERQAP